jgi:hypothetical protein
MTQTENIADLSAALVKAQGEIEGASKSATNPHLKSRYADLSAVWDACRGPLTKNGLAIVQMPRYFENEMRLVTRIVHSSGQWLEDDGFPLLLGKQDMQGLGSATTYARRYGLMAAVGIAPEDDDGNAASDGKGQAVNGAGKSDAKPADISTATAWTNGALPKIAQFGTLAELEAWEKKCKANLDNIENNYPENWAKIVDATRDKRSTFPDERAARG